VNNWGYSEPEDNYAAQDYRRLGYPVPDKRYADTFWATCPACKHQFPTSCHFDDGPRDYACDNCPACSAYIEWRVNWWYHIELLNVTNPGQHFDTPLQGEVAAVKGRGELAERHMKLHERISARGGGRGAQHQRGADSTAPPV